MFADSQVTAGGLSSLGKVADMSYLHLRNLPKASITDAVMNSLHANRICRLDEVKLGWPGIQETEVKPAALTRSGGGHALQH